MNYTRRQISMPSLAGLIGFCLLFSGCSPRIGIETQDKPITINLNIKIDHEVKIKVEKDLEEVISKDSKLF